VADNRQFGGAKGAGPSHFGDQLGDRTPGNQPGDAAHCAQCEAMLADALDGTLSAADQAVFDIHMAHCGPCSEMLADARRGAAWLELLRDPRPEPPAELLERILAQTAGSPYGAAGASGIHAVPLSGAGFADTPAPIFGSVPALAPGYAIPAARNILPFRRSFSFAVRASSLGQIMLQPRLAMTAAMAFFSIVLTMNLTGVRVQDLHASDLRPSSLKRDFYSANARAVQYYEGLRVVYELESRVHDLQGNDLQNGAGVEAPSSDGTQAAPPPSSSPSPAQPAGQAPAGQPGQKATPRSGRDHKQPAPNPGTSRREELNQSRRLVASSHSHIDDNGIFILMTHAHQEGSPA